MSFTKIAKAEQRRILSYQRAEERQRRGWHGTSIPAALLVELGIEYETEDSTSPYAPDVVAYAPVWVFGVWFNAGMPIDEHDPKWGILKTLLMTTRDSAREKEMVASEIMLEGSISKSARLAAQNFLEVLHGKRKTEVSDESP